RITSPKPAALVIRIILSSIAIKSRTETHTYVQISPYGSLHCSLRKNTPYGSIVYYNIIV
ncbi:MAG: hypothetical protein IKF90_16345, partial [Parasporobacterium sp.]|nr:hypothetical protein [Parasporobacterium sp.]